MTPTLSPRIKLYYLNAFRFIKTSTLQINEIALIRSSFLKGTIHTVLNSEEQNICEGALTEKECLEALMSMDPNKTPGTDGLPAEF